MLAQVEPPIITVTTPVRLPAVHHDFQREARPLRED
jgi:hypothetical protein